MSELNFTIFDTAARAEQTNHVLSGFVSEDVTVMEVDGQRLLYNFIEEGKRRWWAQVQLTEQESEFVVRAGRPITASGELVTPDEEWWISQRNLAIFAASGEVDASGEWSGETYRSEQGLINDGWEYESGGWSTDPGDLVTILPTYNGLTPASHPVLDAMRAAGLTSSDNLWTYLFRGKFQILANDEPTNLTLSIRYRSAAAVYINGNPVWRSSNLSADWVFAEYAVDEGEKNELIDLADYITLLHPGENTIAIALKAAQGVDAFLEPTLNYSGTLIEWSQPQTAKVNLFGNTLRADSNFNNLDRLGLLLDLPRLPGEKNADYKLRLINYTGGDWPHNASPTGLPNGISIRTGSRLDYAFDIVSNRIKGQDVASNISFWISEGKAYVTCDQFVQIDEDTPDVNYCSIELSKTLLQLHSMASSEVNEVNPAAYKIENNTIFFRLKEMADQQLKICYQYAEELDIVGKDVADIVQWINALRKDEIQLLEAVPTEAQYWDVIESENAVVTDGSTAVYSRVNLTDLDIPVNIHFKTNQGDRTYRVASFDGQDLVLEEPYSASGDLSFPSPSGDFIPGASGEVPYQLIWSPGSEFLAERNYGVGDSVTVPLYQISLERLDDRRFEELYDPEQRQVPRVRNTWELIGAVKKTFRPMWSEQVLGLDVWDAIEQRLVGGGKIPSHYDPVKAMYHTEIGTNYYTPEYVHEFGTVDTEAYQSDIVTIEAVVADTKKVFIRGKYAQDFYSGRLVKLDSSLEAVEPMFAHTVEDRSNNLWFNPLGGRDQIVTELTLNSVKDIVPGDKWLLQIVPPNVLESVTFGRDDFISGTEFQSDYLYPMHKDLACVEIESVSGEFEEYVPWKLNWQVLKWPSPSGDYRVGIYEGCPSKRTELPIDASGELVPYGCGTWESLYINASTIGFYAESVSGDYTSRVYLNSGYNHDFRESMALLDLANSQAGLVYESASGDLVTDLLLPVYRSGRMITKEVDKDFGQADNGFILAASTSGELWVDGPDLMMAVKFDG